MASGIASMIKAVCRAIQGIIDRFLWFERQAPCTDVCLKNGERIAIFDDTVAALYIYMVTFRSRLLPWIAKGSRWGYQDNATRDSPLSRGHSIR